VAAPAPVLLDEYQQVPELLDAIKAELNRDLRAGRYLLAGGVFAFEVKTGPVSTARSWSESDCAGRGCVPAWCGRWCSTPGSTPAPSWMASTSSPWTSCGHDDGWLVARFELYRPDVAPGAFDGGAHLS
jgi:hypothetical protein